MSDWQALVQRRWWEVTLILLLALVLWPFYCWFEFAGVLSQRLPWPLAKVNVTRN